MKFHKLKIIEDVKEIVGCQNILFNILVDRADKEIHGRVFAGEPLEGDIYYISDLGLGICTGLSPKAVIGMPLE